MLIERVAKPESGSSFDAGQRAKDAFERRRKKGLLDLMNAIGQRSSSEAHLSVAFGSTRDTHRGGIKR